MPHYVCMATMLLLRMHFRLVLFRQLMYPITKIIMIEVRIQCTKIGTGLHISYLEPSFRHFPQDTTILIDAIHPKCYYLAWRLKHFVLYYFPFINLVIIISRLLGDQDYS